MLVVDFSVNWFDVFRGAKAPGGEALVVDQTEWKLMDVAVDAAAPPGRRLVVSIQPTAEPFDRRQAERRVVRPEALLIRNFPRGLHGVEYRNLLLGMQLAGVLVAVNSIHSVLQCQDRPLLYGELLRIRDRLGREAFPLIDMQYFANLSAAHTPLIAPALPLVAKVSNTHAGFGKARFGAGKSDEFDDFRSVLALHTDYFTTEPFVERVASEYRVQRIGEHP